MQQGSLTNQYDVALLALDVFFILFVLLVLHLRREDRREGYPLIRDKSSNPRWQSFDFLPKPKTFKLPHGGEVTVPRTHEEHYELRADTSGLFQGLPIVPTGNPMLDGIGPAAYAMRADTAELGYDDEKPRIVPLRLLSDFYVATADPDPRGWPVLGADGAVAGPVRDVWVDRSEVVIRYIEVDAGARRVLVPMPLVRISKKSRTVKVKSVLAHHFAQAPMTKSLDEVTMLEEEKISAYFASGQLYATPARAEPLLWPGERGHERA